MLEAASKCIAPLHLFRVFIVIVNGRNCSRSRSTLSAPADRGLFPTPRENDNDGSVIICLTVGLRDITQRRVPYCTPGGDLTVRTGYDSLLPLRLGGATGCYKGLIIRHN